MFHCTLRVITALTSFADLVVLTRPVRKTGRLLPIMSFTAAAFQLSDAQVAQLPSEIVGKSTCVFSRHQLGKFGFGERFRFTTCGPERFAAARDHWAQLTDGVRNQLPASLTPSAPICFAAFTFDSRSAVNSVMTVPKFVLDRSATATWLRYTYPAATIPPDPETIFAEFLDELPPEPPVAESSDVTTVSAQLSEAAFQQAVKTAVEMLAQQDFEKIVLARDELLRGGAALHIPATMRALAADNPTAWTYKVDNLIGSTPELLIARHSNAAKARVLAGTVDRDVAINEQLIAEQLSDSPKQLFEHQAAVDSLVEKLAPFATRLQVSEQPFVLPLPNVYHLATDVSAELTSTTSILDLVAEINPTAAVGGTPRDAAVDAIWQLEAQTHGMDRGLYAGAVGWLDAAGQGEFGIALRGSIIEDAHHVRVFAGGGIVHGSDPEAELAETHAKMRPMKKALRVRCE